MTLRPLVHFGRRIFGRNDGPADRKTARPPDMVPAHVARRITGMSAPKFRRLLDDGTIPFAQYTPGGWRYVPREHLEKMIGRPIEAGECNTKHKHKR